MRIKAAMMDLSFRELLILFINYFRKKIERNIKTAESEKSV
jgi:hypothetical protein